MKTRDSHFDRLLDLGSRPDPHTGHSDDTRLDAQLDQQLGRQHERAFAEWLLLNLKGQYNELRKYFRSCDQDPPTIIQPWAKTRWYDRLVPAAAMAPERALFMSDFEMILALVYSDLEAENENPDPDLIRFPRVGAAAPGGAITDEPAQELLFSRVATKEYAATPARSDEDREGLRSAVFRSPSIFGRLMAVSELHNPTKGRYEHHLAAEYGGDTVDYMLRRMHREVFLDWLSLRLEQQEKDLRIWLSWLGRTLEESSRLLQGIQGRLTALLPREYVLKPERFLFLDDFQLVVGLICESESLTIEACQTRRDQPKSKYVNPFKGIPLRSMGQLT